jgi:TusA-related sulfurtransferase
MARIDVPHFAAEAGIEVLEFAGDGSALNFLVRKAP